MDAGNKTAGPLSASCGLAPGGSVNSADFPSGKVMQGTTAARKHAGRHGSTEAGLCPSPDECCSFELMILNERSPRVTEFCYDRHAGLSGQLDLPAAGLCGLSAQPGQAARFPEW